MAVVAWAAVVWVGVAMVVEAREEVATAAVSSEMGPRGIGGWAVQGPRGWRQPASVELKAQAVATREAASLAEAVMAVAKHTGDSQNCGSPALTFSFNVYTAQG